MLRRRNGHAPRSVVLSAGERIRQRTTTTVARVASRGPDAVLRRLCELDAEWDVDHACALGLAVAALAGLAASSRGRGRGLLVAGAASALLAHCSWTRASPLRPLLRRLGLRTWEEIEEERQTFRAAL